MLLRVQHETKLRYSDPVAETVFEVRMSPQTDEDQTNLGYRLRITPATPVTSYRDGFGNRVDLFNIMAPYQDLAIQTTTLMRTHRRDGQARLAEATMAGDGGTALEALEYLQPSTLVNRCPDLDAFVAGLARQSTSTTLSSRSIPATVARVMEAVQGRMKYEKKVTTARTPVCEALALGRGVCQDFAHLFLGACRGLGLPARYVSGYVCGPGELATHAWCQVSGGPAGWIDIDPTRGTFVDDNYIVTAVGRDFADVPPNRGVWKGQADEVITVAVQVEPTERMPADWSEWGAQAPWSGTAWTQSQRHDRRPVPFSKTIYRQQQSQQQQAALPEGLYSGL
jgi:transglutaminase-like putative cysteine protease